MQVTHDGDPANDRSESAIAADPRDPSNLIGCSKRFTDPARYRFSLAAYTSLDAGRTWAESPPLALPATVLGEGVDGVSDPTVAFDDQGTAYILGLAFHNPDNPDAVGDLLGMVAYRSVDNGRTWSAPTVVHEGTGDDKQALAGDVSPASPHRGNVYGTWDFNGDIVFARTTDHGAGWKGITQRGADQPAGSVVIPNAFFSTIAVDSRGHVHVLGVGAGPQADQTAILHVTSTDGGGSFGAVQVAASPITMVGEVPGDAFRVETIPTSCVTTGDRLVVAWADGRNGGMQIYRRATDPGGATWIGPASGALLTASKPSAADRYDLQPQLAATPAGEVGCALYEYGPRVPGGPGLIDVQLLVSEDAAASFAHRVTVTDRPWDPTVDEPNAPGGERFIGDYFGLAASDLGLFPLWTDTRTGIQEMFTAQVLVRHPTGPPAIDVVATNEVPHGHPTAISITGSNFVPGDRLAVSVRAGGGPGHVLASGEAVVNELGFFDWGAPTRRHLPCDAEVSAVVDGSIAASTSVVCP